MIDESGMYVSGFLVRSLSDVEGKPLAYGLFTSYEKAEEWQRNMNVETVIETVYVPAFNRG
jgi:hypothetical protein